MNLCYGGVARGSATQTGSGRPCARWRPLGGGVYGFARGRLMGHRLDFPRENVARIGWIAMPRIAA